MKKILVTGVEARKKLTEGARKLSEAVMITLGPFGRNFFIQKGNKVTSDGVTVAREVVLDDEIEELGASAIREAAVRTVDQVGDGTTTAVTLAWHIYQSASKYLSRDAVLGQKTPSEVVEQIEREKNEVIEKLIKMAKPVETKEELIESASIASANRDLGTLIGTTQWELGKEGILLAEKSAERTSSVDRVHGIKIDNGFGTSQVVTNHEKQTLEVEDAKVLLTTHSIKTLEDFQKVMEVAKVVVKGGQAKLVVIARAWTDETIFYCLKNINEGSVKIYPISAPYENMTEKMKDIKAVLGGTFFDSDSKDLNAVDFYDLGDVKRLSAKRMEAIITGKEGAMTNARIQTRVQELKDELKGSVSEFDKTHLTGRISQLLDGFAIINVGSNFTPERARLFDRAEDAIGATRAAFQEGTVPGAGLALKEVSDSLPNDSILKAPLKEVYLRITNSAPKDWKIKDSVRDPLKVLRIALENACVAAASFATAEGASAFKTPSDLEEMFKGRVKPE